MHVLRWPKQRPLTDADSFGWIVTVEPGRLVLTRPGGERVEFADPAELRRLGMIVHAAAVDYDGAVQEAAVKASLARRAARAARTGQPAGLRHQPFAEPPEPPIHMEVPA